MSITLCYNGYNKGVGVDTVGKRLRHYRKARGWKQDALAARAGISQNMVSSIETGTRDGTLDVLVALAAALEIPVSALIDGELILPPPLAELQGEGVPDTSLVELAQIWPELTEEDRQTALAVTRSLWERRAKRIAGKGAPQKEPAAS